MEPDESGLSSYYHHHNQQPLPPQPQLQQQPPQPPQHHQLLQSPTTATATAGATSPTNGIVANTERARPQMVFPHSVPSSAVTSTLETVRRKRGRPRKYGTPEQAAAAKRISSSSSVPILPPKKKDQTLASAGASSSTHSSKKSQLAALGNSGQGFTLHMIYAVSGEDVYQKIMSFVQQSKCEVCVLSASGSISTPSLRQPATSGGNITYEGQFDILSLTGSYIRTEFGGRNGGVSVCLSSTGGQIIGGGIGGPLKAAGPVEIIIGTFLIDTKKDVVSGAKGDASVSMFPSPVGGASLSGVGFISAVDSSGRIPVRGSDDRQSIRGSQFMIQPHAVQVTNSGPTDWTSRADPTSNAIYAFTGHGAHQSPENGNYEEVRD